MAIHVLKAALWAAALSVMFLGVLSDSTHYYEFRVKYTNVTRLCHTKALVSVNDEFPGPIIKVREGDTVVVKVSNAVAYNMTVHWHGVLQTRLPWVDGPAYVTQCPIQQGQSYTYRFRVAEQRGTLFWHAHISWQRATVYGAFLIYPKLSASYPFPKPAAEFTILLGEWWNADVESIIADALRRGSSDNVSDALTMNGQPGVLYNCSFADTQGFHVERGKTYLLRFINAAMNFQLYLAVPNHTLTVVAVDADYTAPLARDVIVLGPGQSADVLITANQPVANYLITASVFSPPSRLGVPFPSIPTTAVLHYNGAQKLSSNLTVNLAALPTFPIFNDTHFVANFTKSLRSYQSHPAVPTKIDHHLFFTLNYATQPCSNCSFLIPGVRLLSSISNITFQLSGVSILDAYYRHISGVYQADFPDQPAFQYNYTGVNLAYNRSTSIIATKVKVLEYGSKVQIVLQDTRAALFESHPIHLHGHTFFVIGEGFGNFDNETDPLTFNLQNPPSRNTVSVPAGGWAAIRFKAANPGVWLLHCHFDLHATWGMDMVFITKNGNGTDQSLLPPPVDLPKC